jgi:MFS family permease
VTAVRDLRVLLRLRWFRRLLAVRLLSQLSDGVFQVALATYVVFSPEKETSPGAIASAMAVLLLPYSLLGPFTGVLLDRWRRRQALLWCNLLRAALSAATVLLLLARAPDWLFYLSALSVTAINRFVLAGLSASLPRVVDDERLVIANAVSPTAGTLAATAGGGMAFLLRLGGAEGPAGDAAVVLVAAVVYLCAGLAALLMPPGLLGPDPAVVRLRLGAALRSTAEGLLEGLRHLAQRRAAGQALGAMTVLRFCYGALTVTVLMLCRYAWNSSAESGAVDGLALLGLAIAVSGAGFFAAAAVTPWATGRLGTMGWIGVCALTAAVVLVGLGLTFAPAPMLAVAFILGLTTQGAKIATDTVVQSSVDDAFRGRVFAFYDVLFNVAFVGAAAVAALMLPLDGRSPVLLLMAATLYGLVATVMFHVKHGATR